MRKVTLLQPNRVVFGNGCAEDFPEYVSKLGLRRAFVVTSPPVMEHVEPIRARLEGSGCEVAVYSEVASEPSISMLEKALTRAKAFVPDAVVGIGGGSAMDLAKLVAALHDSSQEARDCFGIELLQGRRTFLACLPTTSGTGSEVSPNAILLDEAERLKKGVVSSYLMPDTAYVDPLLTVSVPPAVTAATGIDALIHCIEAYTNRYSHPIVDLYVLQGIKLIADNLGRAVDCGTDLEARAAMSLGSLYGGMGLGPVGTAAVHALSYPLGGEYHVPHGIANAVLLLPTMEFNLSAAPERYANVAMAVGAEPAEEAETTARRGLDRLRRLYADWDIPVRLSELGISEDAVPQLVESAMKVTRLLKNNPREVTAEDAEAIYRTAF